MPEYGKDDDKKTEHTTLETDIPKENTLPKTNTDNKNELAKQKSKNVEDDDVVMVQQKKESKVNNKRKRKTDSIDVVVANKDVDKSTSVIEQTKTKDLENVVNPLDYSYLQNIVDFSATNKTTVSDNSNKKSKDKPSNKKNDSKSKKLVQADDKTSRN